MLSKRLIVCLDVRDGKVTKGVQFKGNVEVGEPVAMAEEYYRQGVDELVFYDITASAEGRPIDIEMVREVARRIFIPFSVGGGIRNLDDMRQVLLAGAEKVSVNSLAVREPQIISDGARAFGNQCIVLGMDALEVGASESIPSGYEIVVKGGRERTGIDMLEWAKRAEELGAGEICLNSIDADGTRDGYELTATRMVSRAVEIPVIASGGAGASEHLARVLTEGEADAGQVDVAEAPGLGAHPGEVLVRIPHVTEFPVEHRPEALRSHDHVSDPEVPVHDGAAALARKLLGEPAVDQLQRRVRVRGLIEAGPDLGKLSLGAGSARGGRGEKVQAFPTHIDGMNACERPPQLCREPFARSRKSVRAQHPSRDRLPLDPLHQVERPAE